MIHTLDKKWKKMLLWEIELSPSHLTVYVRATRLRCKTYSK